MISSKRIPRKKRRGGDVDNVNIGKIQVTSDMNTRSMRKRIKVELSSSLPKSDVKLEEQHYIHSSILPVPDKTVSNQEGVIIHPVTPDEVISNCSTTSDKKQRQKHCEHKKGDQKISRGINSKVKIETNNQKIKKQKKKKKQPPSKTKTKFSGSTMRPTPSECQYVTDALAALHPETVVSISATNTKIEKHQTQRQTLLESCGMRDDITDAIVSTMLSQNTTDKNSKAAYKKLKQSFPDWEDVANCDDITKIEACIKVAGLAKTRAERIQSMLRIVQTERGAASMNYIQYIPKDEDVKKELSRFKGLGPKTISCVLLFALGRPEFPVDTHVLRITKSMNWLDDKETREGAYEHLNKVVPNHLKLDLHCLLVRHGKCCHSCAARNRPQFPPKDGSKLNCPLVHVSKWGGSIPVSKEETPKIKIKKEES